MKRIPQAPRSRRRKEAGHFLAIIAVLFGCLLLIAIATPPAWWASRGVTNTNAADDYAALNQGQLKNLVKGAVQEMDEHLPGGAGNALHQLVSAWAAPTSKTDDYAAVNLGQLKAVAKRVYDRFQQEGLVTAYPWDNSAFAPDDFAMAGIGQAKNLFAFDLVARKFDAYHAPGGDGIPYRWKLQHGLDPRNPNLASQMAPGGLTYLDKYRLGLNPLVADTDGDGMADGQDRFPSDARRSDFIPAKFYAVTDLNAYLPANVKATFEAEQIAIDDNHTVAFFGTSGGGATGHAYQWQNGNLTETSRFAMVTPPDRSGTPMTSQDLAKFGIADGGPGTGGTLVSELTVNSINSSATLAMSASTSYMAWYYYPAPPYPFDFPGPWFAGQGTVSYGTSEWPLTQIPWPGGWIPDGMDPRDPQTLTAGATIAVDNAGYKLAWDLDWALSDPLDPESGRYRYRTLFGEPEAAMQEIPALSEGSTVFSIVDHFFLTCYGLNNHGAFLVKGLVDDEAHPSQLKPAYRYYEAGILHDAPDGIIQMNDQHQAIGETHSPSTGTAGWFGFEISSGNWMPPMPLLDLLKWTNKPPGTRDDWDKFHSHLRNIRPKFITDVDPATVGAGIVIAGRTFNNGVPHYIMVSAQFADEAPANEPPNTTWTSGELLFEFDSSDTSQSNWRYRLKQQRYPAGVVLNSESMNSNGSLVGFGEAPAAAAAPAASGSQAATPSNANKPVVAFPFEFKPREWKVTVPNTNPADLLIGFDPPIPGDRTPANSDADFPEWWASITSKGPLSTNRKLRVTLGPQHPAGISYKLIVTGGLKDMLTVTPDVVNANSTDITLQATANAADIKQPLLGNVEVYQIAGENFLKLAGPALTVQMFPPVTVNIGIYFLDDPTTPLDDVPNPRPVTSVGVIAALNKTYAASGINFQAQPSQIYPPDCILPWKYDVEPKDGKLSFMGLDQEAKSINKNEWALPAKINVVFAKGLVNIPAINGIAPIWDNKEQIAIHKIVFVGWDNRSPDEIEKTAAHEIGHALRISTRDGFNPTYARGRVLSDEHGHDFGVFPNEALQELSGNSRATIDGIMCRPRRDGNREFWLRHEDWRPAWTTAYSFFR